MWLLLGEELSEREGGSRVPGERTVSSLVGQNGDSRSCILPLGSLILFSRRTKGKKKKQKRRELLRRRNLTGRMPNMSEPQRERREGISRAMKEKKNKGPKSIRNLPHERSLEKKRQKEMTFFLLNLQGERRGEILRKESGEGKTSP